MEINKLNFGTAGVPLSANPRTTIDGIGFVKKLGLSAMELEFVHSVNITKEKAPLVKEQSVKNDVILTCHGQYFINLSAKEKIKQLASVQRILNAARIAHACGAWSLTFHAGFYLGEEKTKVYNIIKSELKQIVKTLKSEGNNIWVRPETTGKNPQFGSFEELLQLSSELEQVMPCFDFAHIHARSNGKYNTLKEFTNILEDVEKYLGKRGLQNMHMHMAGIDYSDKGERKHLILEESDMNYKDLMKVLKDFNVKGVLICESPNIESDALLMKRYYDEIK